MALSKSMNDEQRRAAREGLNECELAIFDLMQKSILAATERERIQRSSRELLAELQRIIAPLDQWTEKEQTRAEVQTVILDRVFLQPEPPYTPDEKDSMAKMLCAHVWQQGRGGRFGDDAARESWFPVPFHLWLPSRALFLAKRLWLATSISRGSDTHDALSEHSRCRRLSNSNDRGQAAAGSGHPDRSNGAEEEPQPQQPGRRQSVDKAMELSRRCFGCSCQAPLGSATGAVQRRHFSPSTALRKGPQTPVFGPSGRWFENGFHI